MKRVALSLLFVIALMLVWEGAFSLINDARLESGDTSLEAFVPAPSTVVHAFSESGSVIAHELAVTLGRAGLGLVLGAGLAWLLFLLFMLYPPLRSLVFPVNMAINSFPIIGFAPAIVLLFGQGSWVGIVFVSMLISYFPILVTLDNTYRSIPKDFADMMSVFNATRSQLIRLLYIPLLLPELAASLRLAIPAAIIGATIGEWLGTRSGIGHLVTVSLYQLDPGTLYAALIALAAASLALVGLLYVVERRVFPWRAYRT